MDVKVVSDGEWAVWFDKHERIYVVLERIRSRRQTLFEDEY